MNKLWKKIKHLFSHDYYYIRKLKTDSELLGCSQCNGRFVMNHTIRMFTKTDNNIISFYESIGENTKDM